MSAYLYDVQQENRLRQSGLLKRFSLNCYGKQETLDSIRSEKTSMFAKLKKGTKEFDEWFLKYNPANNPKLRRKKTTKKRKSVVKSAKSSENNITYELEEAPKASDTNDSPEELSEKEVESPKKKHREGFLY